MQDHEIDFVNYLKTTLIPDLRNSGNDATADDFQTSVRIMLRLHHLIEAQRVALNMAESTINVYEKLVLK